MLVVRGDTFGGFGLTVDDFFQGHAFAQGLQVVLGLLISARLGGGHPDKGADIVLLGPLAFGVHRPEFRLGSGVTLLCQLQCLIEFRVGQTRG